MAEPGIVYCLIETGMRRAAVCNLDLSEVDFAQNSVTVREKGGQSLTRSARKAPRRSATTSTKNGVLTPRCFLSLCNSGHG